MLAAICLFTLLTCASSSIVGQKPIADTHSTPFTRDFDALVQSTLGVLKVPGLSIAVIDGNKTFAKGYGIAQFPDVKATPETLYWTGSTTKSFTAAAVSLLIDDTAHSSKPVRWTTPISSLIREDFVVTDEYATAHITLEDALSHRTGLPRHDLSYGGPKDPPFTLRDVVRSLRYLPMTAELRAKFQYCNIMYKVVSYVIETLTGMWLGDFLRIRIWEPLHMNSTYFSPEDAQKAVAREGKVLANGYYWNDKSQQYGLDPWFPGGEESGDGSVISSVLDYAKWLRAMMDMAPPISPAGHRALRTPRSFSVLEEMIPNTGPTSYSLGWSSIVYHGQTIYLHQGGIPGFGTMMLYMPWRKWGVTMMGNTVGGSNFASQILTYNLVDTVLEVPTDERFNWMEKIEKDMRKQADFLQNGRKYLFPDTRAKPIPKALPLKDYTGTYSHPAYQSFNLTLVLPDKDVPLTGLYPEKVLYATVQRSFTMALHLEHISGEYFVLYTHVVRKESKQLLTVSKALFRLGPDGRVKEAGLVVEEAMGEEMIWFEKTT